MNWLHYLLEANIYLGVFYLLYFLLLNNETHYKLNRAYLLFTPVLSYIIPLVQVGALKSFEDDGNTVTTIIINPTHKVNSAAASIHFTLQDVLLYGYLAGAGIMLTVFIFKIIQLVKLTRAQKSLFDNKYKLVKVKDTNTAFSFFNYVFIGTNVDGADTMIRHELVHIEQKHSFDIVFLELLKIVNWFNPFIYLWQRSVKTLHEYIADEQTAAYENDAIGYSSFLVSNAYGLSGSSISNSFFNYNLLKKRIIMLNQKRSGNLARLKYLAVIPLSAGLLCVSTLGFSKTYGWVDLAPQTAAKSGSPTTTIKDTKTGVSTKEEAYKINGKTYYKATITDKTGKTHIYYSKNTSVADRAMLWQKYQFHFSSDTVKSITLSPPPSLKLKSIPPPPPPAPPKSKKAALKAKSDEITIDEPTKTPATIIKSDIAAARAKAESEQHKTPPPPPPMGPFMAPSKVFDEMNRYVSKHVRYPAVARENKSVGSVIVKFDIAENRKLSNVILIKGIGSGCDEEVLRVIKGFTGDINTKSGTYKLTITFNLDGIDAPKSASESLGGDPSFAGEIVVMGYPSK
ncbi:M56 family metallopeptidase [Mucilaginibacter sp. BJC16-A38]|uniref:M56 family metallopeptidase n=1 Tax=Mucilaginibacter phenanthrenivorans TaxID=1234842 RepID=UPI0021586EA1|nr:M56 family metallopeptidase [Mucilaginibacter phenanthrenivorans]MCR8559834.1 M56 family metallopeptidase [Mucilaginibacter phenanthrenivorans]